MSLLILSSIIIPSLSIFNFISTKIYQNKTGKKKTFFWTDKILHVSQLQYTADLEAIKKRIRIVVIDDEDGFPLKLFQAEGYALDKWSKVTEGTYGKLEAGFYDIIILDIKGVAEDISENDGLGVLESIKKKNPAQIIIAYSQHTYDLSKTKFFQLADENIKKPSDFLKIKDTLDTLINTKFNPSRYIDSLYATLRSHNIPNSEIEKLDNAIYKSIQQKKEPNWKSVLTFAKDNGELFKQIVALGNSITKFFH